MLCTELRKKLVMLHLCYELLTFPCEFLSQFAGTAMFNYKHFNLFLLMKIAFNILYTKFCLGLFFYANSTLVCFSSDKNMLELSNKVL